MARSRRVRRTHSITTELLAKSREAGLAAVQIFNSPLLTFKSEIFIVLMNIAWTYLLHAYYRRQKFEYRYYKVKNGRRSFDKTKSGANKFWELAQCLNYANSPIDSDTANNLRFLIGIRHEIEHQMTSHLDNALSAKFQACCLNFNQYLKTLFGEKYGIDKFLSLSLQFSAITQEQAETLPSADTMPPHIKAFVEGFEKGLKDEEFNSPKFAYRVLFVAKTANHKGQADQVIEFVKADSPLAKDLNKAYTVIKEIERPKHRPSAIVAEMKKEGFKGFNMAAHTNLWHSLDAKRPSKGFGVTVENTWYWYDSWLDEVRRHVEANAAIYR